MRKNIKLNLNSKEAILLKGLCRTEEYHIMDEHDALSKIFKENNISQHIEEHNKMWDAYVKLVYEKEFKKFKENCVNGMKRLGEEYGKHTKIL